MQFSNFICFIKYSNLGIVNEHLDTFPQPNVTW